MEKTCPSCHHTFQSKPYQHFCEECRTKKEKKWKQETNKRYQLKHKEELKEKRKIYLAKNHEHIMEYQKAYRKSSLTEKLCRCGKPREFRKILCEECRVANRRALLRLIYQRRNEEQREKRRIYMRQYMNKVRELKKNETIKTNTKNK